MLVQPSELAKMLGVSLSCLAKWRMQGDGPAFLKLGSRIAYRPEAVETWLTERERKSTSDRAAA
jgi:predicted DNA-binding transcriptional regulator AlpA